MRVKEIEPLTLKLLVHTLCQSNYAYFDYTIETDLFVGVG